MALIVVGLIAGVLAKWVMPGPDPGGIIITILIGIAGAFVGGFIVQRLGGPALTQIGVTSILVSTLGAVLLLAVYRAVTRRSV